ncbi:asparagine synthase (glutamine-hydrolyzing) [Candidatus Nitrospira bockiana]
MCGIAGVLNLQGNGTVDRSTVEPMARAMVHRGPDDDGLFTSGPVGLAHRRLSIIDLATGHQPMFNEDGSIAIVFNGEIYNHRTLRTNLESKGHVYRTSSDTESIVHAYEEFGDDFESHLTGMFAFALWDAARQQLVLSRDRLGIKPLYFTIHRDQLLFASEIKAILAVPGIEPRVDLDALDAYLSLRYVPGPKTLFKGISKLQPGHTLIAHQGRTTIRCYWDLHFAEDHAAESTAVEEFTTLLHQVCEEHLMSEVPYGVFLSGGVDSSAIAATLQTLLHDRVTTFTVGYEDAEGVNEFHFADSVAHRLNTIHHSLTLRAADFAEWIPDLVWHLDEPVGDPACIPLYFLSREAKPYATVLHSGEGADELLAGYSIYRKMQLLDRLYHPFLAPGYRALARIAGQGKLARYLRLLGKPLDVRYRGVSGHFLEGRKEELIKPGTFTQSAGYLNETFAGYFAAVRGQAPLNQMLYVDTKTWLPDDLLVKADKMTMAASIELRVPFLDHRLVEFAARLPADLKIRNGETKYLLKKAVESDLPHDVVYRTKKGFPVPIAQWFKAGLHEVGSDLLLGPKSVISGFCEAAVIRRMLAAHKEGQCDLSNELWGLLVLEMWFQKFGVAA